MAYLKKVRIIGLIFVLIFCNENGKVLANLRNFPDGIGIGNIFDIRDVPSTYDESISSYQEYTLFELGIANRLFGKYCDLVREIRNFSQCIEDY